MTDVLVLCHANLCRSPMAEHLVRAELDHHGRPWTVRSAGVAADDGSPVHPEVVPLLTSRGVDVAPDWTSRLLRPAMIDDAALILTSTRSQLEHVLQRRPSAMHRTFVFGHLAALLDLCPADERPATPADLATRARAARTRLANRPADAFDLADPVLGGTPAFEQCARTLDGYVAALGRHLAGAVPT